MPSGRRGCGWSSGWSGCYFSQCSFTVLLVAGGGARGISGSGPVAARRYPRLSCVGLPSHASVGLQKSSRRFDVLAVLFLVYRAVATHFLLELVMWVFESQPSAGAVRDYQSGGGRVGGLHLRGCLYLSMIALTTPFWVTCSPVCVAVVCCVMLTSRTGVLWSCDCGDDGVLGPPVILRELDHLG